MYISDPCPPSFTYSFQASLCVYNNYLFTLSWMETNEFCAAKSGRMMTFESQRKLDRILEWRGTSRSISVGSRIF